jgi:hypothetical protein
MIQPADAQQLISKWWFAYDNALFDEWPAMWTSDAHFSCRSDTGQTAFEEFVTADAQGREAVLAWRTDHRLHSPHPLRHGGENVHVDPGDSFRSYIRVSQIVGFTSRPDRARLTGGRAEGRRPQRRARHRGLHRWLKIRSGTADVEVALAC